MPKQPVRFVTLALFLIVTVSVVADVYLSDPLDWRSETVDFTSLQAADALTVRIASQDVRTISDAGSLAAVARFVQDHQDRWRLPWTGIPVGRVTIEFSSQGSFIGDLNVGYGFVVTQHQGGFYVRSITVNDQGQLLDLLGLTSGDLDWGPHQPR